MADVTKSEKGPRRSKVSRSITVCLKCRSRKVRCDKQFPTCGNCAKTGNECLMLDPYTGERVHRASIHSLRLELEEKTAELNALKLQLGMRTSPTPERASGDYGSEVDSQTGAELGAEFGCDFFFGSIRTTYIDGANIELPNRKLVDECVCVYFKSISTQLPVLHRDYFLFHYYKPVYGRVGPHILRGIFGSNFKAEAYSEESLPEYGAQYNEKCLFFVLIVVAISASHNQQTFSLAASRQYHKLALAFANHVWRASEDHDEISKLEILQSLLLLAQYSLMRPSNPGSWYTVGTCVRLCQDLGLDNEPKFLRSGDCYIVDLRRRLFWCCYCLDRQVSNYVGRQFAIENSQTDCPLLTTRDDSALVFKDSEMKRVGTWLHSAPNFKKLTIHYINLRVLQGGIYEYIHCVDNRITQQNFFDPKFHDIIAEHDAWKKEKHHELLSWLRDSLKEIEAHQEFDRLIMSLNFEQTLIQIYERNPMTPVITKDEHYMILFESGRRIMHTYHEISKKKLINYSWVAINNLFMGCRSYLLSVTKSESLKNRLVPQDIHEDCHKALEVFTELKNIYYDPAQSLMKKFRSNISYTVEVLVNWKAQHNSAGEGEKRGAYSAYDVPYKPQPEQQVRYEWEDELWGSDIDATFKNTFMGSTHHQIYAGIDQEAISSDGFGIEYQSTS